MVKFSAVLTPDPDGRGGTFIPVPREVNEQLGLRGRPKIQAVIAGQPYRGSLMPMGDGTFCLGVLKSIQETAGVKQGDTIEVLIELDTEPRTVEPPADLATVLGPDSTRLAPNAPNVSPDSTRLAPHVPIKRKLGSRDWAGAQLADDQQSRRVQTKRN